MNRDAVSLVVATQDRFARLLEGQAPLPRIGPPVGDIAPQPVLAMLAGLAAEIETQFAPAVWLIVRGGRVAGLCSLVKVPAGGRLTIGYGTAAGDEGSGVATRAVGELAEWARHDRRVDWLAADTAVGNIASQRVLERNGFSRCGTRHDDEDGDLICWELAVGGTP